MGATEPQLQPTRATRPIKPIQLAIQLAESERVAVKWAKSKLEDRGAVCFFVADAASELRVETQKTEATSQLPRHGKRSHRGRAKEAGQKGGRLENRYKESQVLLLCLVIPSCPCEMLRCLGWQNEWKDKEKPSEKPTEQWSSWKSDKSGDNFWESKASQGEQLTLSKTEWGMRRCWQVWKVKFFFSASLCNKAKVTKSTPGRKICGHRARTGTWFPAKFSSFFWPRSCFPFCLAMSQEWKRQEGGRGWNAGNGSEDRSRT